MYTIYIYMHDKINIYNIYTVHIHKYACAYI